jgi:hypothetical protein
VDPHGGYAPRGTVSSRRRRLMITTRSRRYEWGPLLHREPGR